MAQNDTSAPRIKFYQNHRPAMDAGEYSISIGGSIKHTKIGDNNTAPSFTRRFAVYGERFSLNDQDVRAVFPAAGSTGEYASILPHIILNRNTLPWERHAFGNNQELPWLVLLLFDEDETPEKKIVAVKDLWTSPAGAGQFPFLPKEAAQHDDEKLTVIDVPRDVLQKIMPSTASLLLLAHTRQGTNDNNELVGEENAVVFCNRLPEQGKRSTMHLVSVEGRYNATGFDFSGGENLFRLVSLKSWEFYTLEHFKITTATLEALNGIATADDLDKISTLLDREFAGAESNFLEEVAAAMGMQAIPNTYKAELIQSAKFDKTFDGILKNLNKDLLTLRLPPNNNAAAETYLSQGLVPLLHHFRNGDRSVSWYRGPFVPFKPGASTAPAILRDLQPETADELTKFDVAQGMFDVTYSAAWEIGRLMALASKDFAVSLFQWKRLLAQHQHQARQLSGNEHLPVFAHGHNHELEAPLWENHLRPWLNQLATFQNVPANYLVPDEALLPLESIRFFYVDKNWQVAALSGAFSVGGDWDRGSQADENAFNDFLALEDAYVMGFLLRSDVVAGWPGLLIDGKASDDSPQAPLRRQLSRDVLLCLFNREIKHVVFHQKPEVMHFGGRKENDSFFKKVRDDKGAEVDGEVQSGLRDRVIDIKHLAKILGKDGNPAQFAMNMIEGVPQVVFDIG